MSLKLNPNEKDPYLLWAEIARLRAAAQGPTGFATWQDAATAERLRRVQVEKELADLRTTLSRELANIQAAFSEVTRK